MKSISLIRTREQKGITLIALVVTVIVLIILAGVSIAMLVGENGIITQAQRAAQETEQAQRDEEAELNKAADLIEMYAEGVNTATTVKDAIAQNKRFAQNTKIRDDLNNEVTIPQGFKVANDSATKVEDGIVIEDKDGNQFVWIPAKTESEGGATINLEGGTTTIVYKRTAYSTNVATGEMDEETDSEKITFIDSEYYFKEAMQSDEEKSINANGGYYIGRYEAGDKESTQVKSMREEGASQTNTVTIKKGQAPYNYITQSEAKKLAENMSVKQGYNATTKLVNSYAWDTAISFIQIKNTDYGSSSIEGNYMNVPTFTYTDINGNTQTKNKDTEVLIPTGQTTSVSNIYDMGGNLNEYTTESNSDVSRPIAFRGGDYRNDYEWSEAGFRSLGDGLSYGGVGFRIVMYI